MIRRLLYRLGDWCLDHAGWVWWAVVLTLFTFCLLWGWLYDAT